MEAQNYQIITGLVIGTIVFLIIGFFIIILVAYFNSRKKKFILEKQLLQTLFNEQLLKSQLEMQEQTFNAISQEIHDNVGQSLSLAKMQLHLVERGKTFNEKLITDTQDSIAKAITDLRDIAKSLNTERIHQTRLTDIIAGELSRLNRSGLLTTEISAEGEEREIGDQKKLIVFRMLQEALQNILKHAQASGVSIAFRFDEDTVQIKVSDNGKGFARERITKKDGLGLNNMQSRASLIGGDLRIDSALNEGTTITITAPYV